MKLKLKAIFQYKFMPVYLLLLCTIAYGIFIPWLGSYSDDLSFLYYYRSLGANGLRDLLENERPMQGFLYSLTIPLLGTSPIVWQIAALLTHWLSAVGVWFLLSRLWSSKHRQNAWVAALYAVFPGFIEHWMALTWSHLFLMNAIAFSSLGLMLCSFTAKKNKGWLIAASIVTGALNLIYSEYSYGLEFSRVLIIYLFIIQSDLEKKERIRWTLKKYWPYFIMLAIIMIWRFWIFDSGKYNLNLSEIYGNSTWTILWGLIKETAIGFFRAALQAWGKTAEVFKIGFHGIAALFIWLVILVMIAVSFIFFFFTERFSQKERGKKKASGDKWWIQAVILGIIGLVFSLIPFIAAGNKINLDLPEKRFMISFAFPSSLILISVLDAHYKYFKSACLILFIIILGLSTGRQIKYADTFRKSLLLEQKLFWQLKWRIPALEPGTILVTQDLAFDYFSENQLTANINLLYDPENRDEEQNYGITYTNGRVRQVFEQYQPGQDLFLCDREDLCVNGNTTDILVFSFAPTSCVSILGGEYSTYSTTLPDFRQQLGKVIPASNLELITLDQEDQNIPFVQVFGKEPLHDWCYYFEKADLARSKNDWVEVVRLWDETLINDVYPKQMNEQLPFLEGLLRVSRWEEAYEMSRNMLASSSWLSEGVCNIWLGRDPSISEQPVSRDIYTEFLTEFDCH